MKHDDNECGPIFGMFIIFGCIFGGAPFACAVDLIGRVYEKIQAWRGRES